MANDNASVFSSKSRRGLFGRKKKSKNGDDSSVAGSAMTEDGASVVSKSKRKPRFSRVKRLFKSKSKSGSSVASSSSKKSSKSPQNTSNSKSNSNNNPSSPSSTGSSSNNNPASDAKESYPANEMRSRDMLKIPEEVLEDLQEDDEEDEEFDPVTGKKKRKTKQSSALLQIVLLLIDPKTRRFELLQLEYDSPKAKVSDTLVQIPKSVTEKSIQSTDYKGIVTSSGGEFPSTARLVDIIPKGKKSILVGLPKDMRGKDAIRLARPILNDSKVSKMLSTNNIDVEGWIAGYTATTSSSTKTATSAAAPPASKSRGIDFSETDDSQNSEEHSNSVADDLAAANKSRSARGGGAVKGKPRPTPSIATLAIVGVMAISLLILSTVLGVRHGLLPQKFQPPTAIVAPLDSIIPTTASISQSWNAVTGKVESVRSKIPTISLPPLHKFVPSMALKKPPSSSSSSLSLPLQVQPKPPADLET